MSILATAALRLKNKTGKNRTAAAFQCPHREHLSLVASLGTGGGRTGTLVNRIPARASLPPGELSAQTAPRRSIAAQRVPQRDVDPAVGGHGLAAHGHCDRPRCLLVLRSLTPYLSTRIIDLLG